MNRNNTFKNKCDDIGDLLYRQYTAEENREQGNSDGCGDLMLEWIKKRMWGQVVKDHISIFESTYDILHLKGNIGHKNRYVYGDIDVGVWIEKTTNPDKRKVIASTRYCSGQNYLYILNGLFMPGPEKYKDYTKMSCRKVWDREKKARCNFGDDRDIDTPSFNTYRKRDFKYGCGDSRDKGHIFTHQENLGPEAEGIHDHQIAWALRYLKWHLDALSNYDENKCW